jgi:hypothetical protein
VILRSLAGENRIFYSLSTEFPSLEFATYKGGSSVNPFEEISCGEKETSKANETRKIIRGCLSKDRI